MHRCHHQPASDVWHTEQTVASHQENVAALQGQSGMSCAGSDSAEATHGFETEGKAMHKRARFAGVPGEQPGMPFKMQVWPCSSLQGALLLHWLLPGLSWDWTGL